MSSPSAVLASAQQRADDFIAATGVLGRTPFITAINEEIGQAEPDFQRLIELMSANPALVARVVTVANSAWYGSHVKVDSAAMALARLGTHDFCHVALSASLQLGVEETPQGQPKLWPHADLTARICGLAAQPLAAELVGDAFLAGLLHDCAVPLMARHLPDYAYLIEDALRPAAEGPAMERECHQTDHCLVGAALCRAWHFPAAVATAVAHHHHPFIPVVLSAGEQRLLSLLVLGERITSLCKLEATEAFPPADGPGLPDEIARALGATRKQVDLAIAEVLRLHQIRVRQS